MRILLIDDNPNDRALVVRELEREFPAPQVEQISNAEDLEAALRAGSFDLVITDYQLNWSNGLAVLRSVRAEHPQTPIIMFTATGSEEIAVQAMKDGLDDYVLKSVKHLSRLTAAVRLALDRLEQRRALEVAEVRYRTLFENLPLGLVHCDPEGRFLDANPAFLRMFCFPDRDALLGTSLADLLVSQASHHELLQEMGRSELVRGWETQARRYDDTNLWVSISARAVREGGRRRFIEAAVEDITDRRRTEAALRLTQSAVSHASDAVVITEAEPLEAPGPRIVYVNEAFTRLTGYRPQQVLGQTMRLLEGQKTDGAALEHLREAMQAHEPARLELLAYRRDLSEVWLDLAVVPVPEPGGALTHFVSLARDITERKHNDRALEKLAAYPVSNPNPVLELAPDGRLAHYNPAAKTLAESLGSATVHAILPSDIAELVRQCLAGGAARLSVERRAGDRTLTWWFFPLPGNESVIGYAVDITERLELETQLRQVQKMEAIGRLAGGIAHDFNNLLTVINGYSTLVASRLGQDDAARQNVEEIRKAGERASALTRQLLAFSRRQVLQPRVLDLNEIINGTASMLRRLISEDIDLVVHLDPALGRVRADASQIEQVILNLAVNARDAMPRGGKLTLETLNVEIDEAYARGHLGARPGHYVMLRVSDTGVGMDAETRARLFEPFFTTKEQGKGTGLGLATVYGIVKQSAGNIWVDSEPERGATFKILLPRVQDEVEKAAPETAAPAPPEGKETILLVEDEPVVRELCSEVLAQHGYTVLAAGDSEEARRLCESRRGDIDLLLTDVVMPRMGGHELAQRLASLCPQMRVLLMSGYSADANRNGGVLDPDLAFLQKPFTPDVLARKVREVLDTSARR